MKLDRSLVIIAAGVTAALHVGKLPPALPALRAELVKQMIDLGQFGERVSDQE